jgi:NAD(P)-dependent dehydrogenase (short-subunit alcohol dehydrogenase family)
MSITTRLLDHKVAVIYGAGGAIGGAVARAFAAEGATVFLTGHNLAPVELVAKDILAAGGSADAAAVDALDEAAIDGHLRSVVDAAGRVDISFNAVGLPVTGILGVPLVDLDVERFIRPLTAYATSYFLTARLAARRMVPNGTGVIMTVSALHARSGISLAGGTARLRAPRRRSPVTCPPSWRRTASGWSACARRPCPRRPRSGTRSNPVPSNWA